MTMVFYNCRICLKTGEDVYSMSQEQIILYRKLLKVFNKDFNMHMCINCGYLVKKYAKFVEQCEKANDIMNIYKQDTKSEAFSSLKCIYNLMRKNLENYYIGPDIDPMKYEMLKDEASDDSLDNDMLMVDDEEIPLVLLTKNEVKVEDFNGTMDRPIKKKRKKNKSLRHENIHMRNKDPNMKSEENVLETKSATVNNDKKVKKELREGFSSRMVQETEEYIVIKLTKEQVLEEMQEKRKSVKYQRLLYKCDKCVKGFNFAEVLHSHMRKHTMEQGTLRCDICDQYCPSMVSLRGHIKSHTTRYKCKVCGDIKLSRQHLLEHHAIKHTGTVAEYSCDICPFTTNKRTVIQRHVRLHQMDESLACERCGKLYKTVQSLRAHTLRHDRKLRFQCEQCFRKFIYPSQLDKHIRSVHELEEFYCVECDVKFKSQDNMKLHFQKAKRHRDPSSYTHKCDNCEEVFITKSALLVHQTSAHGAPKQYSCKFCQKEYSCSDAVRNHIRRCHAEKKPDRVTCHICNLNFCQRSVLVKHLRTHTGERPYQCECGVAFAQKCTLRAHIAAKHNNQDQDITKKSPLCN